MDATKRHIARFDSPPVGVLAQPGKCVYACGRDATTDDHVPASALFVGVPGPPKVPSCLDCNGGSSDDDTDFRLKVVANEKAGKHPAARAVWEAAFRGLQRPEAARYKRRFYESMTYRDVLDGSSGTLRRALTYDSTGGRQGRVIARIARGLYYHDTGGVLSDHHVIGWPVDFLEQNEREPRRPLTDLAHRMWNTVKDRPAIEIGSGVLTYWWESFGGEFVVWFFVFYYGMAFLAMAIPKEARPLPDYLEAFEFPQPLTGNQTSAVQSSPRVSGRGR